MRRASTAALRKSAFACSLSNHLGDESGEQSATQAQGSIRSCRSDNMCVRSGICRRPVSNCCLGVGLCFCWCFAHGSFSIARGFDSPRPYRAGCRSRRASKFIDMTVDPAVRDVHPARPIRGEREPVGVAGPVAPRDDLQRAVGERPLQGQRILGRRGEPGLNLGICRQNDRHTLGLDLGVRFRRQGALHFWRGLSRATGRRRPISAISVLIRSRRESLYH